MKRVLREFHRHNAALRTSLRIREDVDKLQTQLSDIITQALQTKVLVERLAQGDTDVNIYYDENATNENQIKISPNTA